MKKILLLTSLIIAWLDQSSAQQVTITSIVPITSTTIGKFEKFEVGVSLGQTPIIHNPFDPNEIQVYAEFTNSASGITEHVNAFWFQDFERNASSFDPTENDPCKSSVDGISDPDYLTPIPTYQPWRIRFSPDAVGQWSYKIYIVYNGQTSITNTMSLNVTASDNKGNIGVGSNKNHFIYKDLDKRTGEMNFIPLGLNIFDFHSLVFNRAGFNFTEDVMNKLQDQGGNTIRIFMSPENYGIEWEEDGLGKYFNRQNRAYNLDDIFNLAEELGIKIQLVIISNHEFHNNVSDPYNYWERNPYRPLLAGGAAGIQNNQYSFFNNAACINYFKQRLRYVIARWGYSTSLLAYEMWNEVDIMANANPAFWDNNDPDKVINWHNTMIGYGKTMDNRHMFTTSVGFTVCGSATGSTGLAFYNLPVLDYAQDHYYSNDMNVTHNHSIFAQHSIKKYQKPYITGEVGPFNCYFSVQNFTHNNFTSGNYAHDMMDFHDDIWSSLFNGSAGPTFAWSSADLTNKCWGGPYKNFKPINLFLQNDESFFSENLTYIKNNPTGDKGLKDDPSHNYGNNSLPFWSYPNYSSPSQLESYINYDITTSDDKQIDVFAAKSDDKIYGWVHNRNNYWYKLPHNAVGNANDLYTFNDNQPSNQSTIPSLYRQNMTFNNLECDGAYKVDFYSTYAQYDINADNILDDGGIISSFSIPYTYARCGTLTISLPTLAPLSLSSSIIAPDYAFKITKYQDSWSHSLVIGGMNTLSQISIYNSNKLFYSDYNGAIRTTIFDNNTNTYQHNLISPASPNQNEKAVGSICANGPNQVFYKGYDGRLQCYYLTNSGTYDHIWLTDWSSNSQNVGGFITIGPSTIYYQGSDAKIHRYFYNSNTTLWEHSILPYSGDPNQLVAGAIAMNTVATQVYYKGQDGRLQSYYKDNSNNWNHVWMTDWASTLQNVSGDIKCAPEGIFFAGSDGKLHKYYFDSNQGIWVHVYVLNQNNQQINIPSNTQISMIGNADQIYFKGANGQMQQLYAKSGNRYTQDEILCETDLEDGFKNNGNIAATGEGEIYYIGTDNFIHMYAYDAGCDPRENGQKSGKAAPNLRKSIFRDLSKQQSSKSTIPDGIINNAVSISPNPFSNKLSINSSNSELLLTVDIIDVLGRIVYSSNSPNNKFEINTNSFPSGVYIITFYNNGLVLNKKKIVKK
jgi:hypothetical protein